MRVDLKTIFSLFLVGFVFLPVFLFAHYIGPASQDFATENVFFEVREGEGFRDVSKRLQAASLIRSSLVFNLYTVGSGTAFLIKPGIYQISPTMSVPSIAELLELGVPKEAEVTIPEGATIYQVDKLLEEKGILPKGALIAYAKTASQPAEGYLFPDTYRFYVPSSPGDVYARMKENFDRKALPVLGSELDFFGENLVLASLLEKEVPKEEDRRIVAGILKKRLQKGMPLQVDATLCYIRQILANEFVPCDGITRDEMQADHPYSTYQNKGFPPGPIGSPGESAMRAAMNPEASPYWFYLSDPASKTTIFSRDLDEHNRNKVKYILNR